ncbi:unnamed protein product, partial [Cyprideis torosa]
MNSVKKKTFSFGKISLPSTEDASATIAQNPNDDVGEFGKFSGGKQLGRTEEVPQQTEEEDEVAAIMGFSSFSSSSIKKAKNFDLEAELKESLAIASERREKKMNKAIIEGNENKINALKEDDRATSTSRDEGDGYIGPLPPEESTTNVAEESDDEEIGPPLPPSFSAASTSEDKDSDEEGSSENEEEDLPFRSLPISEEIVLNHGAKAVSSLALDPSGARLISGGIDYEVKFWDFAGMDAALQSFRTIKPCESHPIKHLSYSTTGEHVLVVSGSAQAKVLDRDGFEVMECVKGYQYIADMANTKGHTAMLNDGCWNPKVKGQFMTCSHDGSVRLWNLEKPKAHEHIIKIRGGSGLRAVPQACSFNRDGTLIGVGADDGSLQLWDTRRKFISPSQTVRAAHQRGAGASSVPFSFDDQSLLSRGIDDTLKLWDVRRFKTPVLVKDDLFNRFDTTGCGFSPDDRLVFTGVSLPKGETHGRLLFMLRDTFEVVHDMKFPDTAVISCLWHPRLNQIVCGSGNGTVQLFYDQKTSLRGAKLFVGKTKKRNKQSEMMVSQEIYTPYALRAFRQPKKASSKKQQMKDRMDPVKSHKPDMPLYSQGTGGRVAGAGNTLTSYILKNLGISSARSAKLDQEIDPREAILRHAKEAEENPIWVAPAYKARTRAGSPAGPYRGASDFVRILLLWSGWGDDGKARAAIIFFKGHHQIAPLEPYPPLRNRNLPETDLSVATQSLHPA